MWQVDGAQGEGGGQLLRTALALGAATGTPLHIENIRAARRPPGLAPQHLAAAQALAALSDGRLEGAGLRSSALSFWPGATLRDELTVDVGTAGNLILILHTLLPAQAAPRLPDDIGYRYDAFWEFPGCGRTYWQGSHYRNLKRVACELLAPAGGAPSD